MPDVSFYHLLRCWWLPLLRPRCWVLTVELLPLIAGLARLIVAFRTEPITPAASHAFESDLQRLLRDLGQVIVHWVFNRLDPAELKSPGPLT